MSSIIKLLRRIGGAKAVPPTGEAGQVAFYKSGTAATDPVSLYVHDGAQWVELLDTAGRKVTQPVFVGETAPATPNSGAFWFKASTNSLSVWSGAWDEIAFRNITNTFTKSQIIDVTDNAAAALRITQKGTAFAFLVEDDATPDSSPFAIDKDGNVGIGRYPAGYPGYTTLSINGAEADIDLARNGVRTFAIFTSPSQQNLGTYTASSLNFMINGTSQLALQQPDGQIGHMTTYRHTGAGSNVVVDGAGNFMRTSSSIKYKKNVETLDPDLTDSAIAGLRPVWYRTKSPEGDDKAEWSHIGLIAEEVEKVEKRLVKYKTKEASFDDEGNRVVTILDTPEPEDVAYDRLAVLLLDYVQRLEKRIAALEARP